MQRRINDGVKSGTGADTGSNAETYAQTCGCSNAETNGNTNAGPGSNRYAGANCGCRVNTGRDACTGTKGFRLADTGCFLIPRCGTKSRFQSGRRSYGRYRKCFFSGYRSNFK